MISFYLRNWNLSAAMNGRLLKTASSIRSETAGIRHNLGSMRLRLWRQFCSSTHWSLFRRQKVINVWTWTLSLCWLINRHWNKWWISTLDYIILIPKLRISINIYSPDVPVTYILGHSDNGGGGARAFYPVTSYASHDCANNTFRTRDGHGVLETKAKVAIEGNLIILK